MAEREINQAPNVGAARSPPLTNLDGSSKRQRTHQEGASSAVSKPCVLSNLWLDDHELGVGLCFKDRDEMKKAVDWWSIRRKRKYLVREAEKDMYMFECVRWKCRWSLQAARMEQHGLVEITKCTASHTCSSSEYPDDSDPEFVAYEIERMVKLQPALSIAELNKCWKDKFDYELEISELENAKAEAIGRVFEDRDQSFRLLPKLMSALHSSNGLVVDWQYDPLPNPESASFRSVFWAFSQSIEGFQHCRPLIVVDSTNLEGEDQMSLMIASGVDAANEFFPLAFVVTKDVSSDTWRWFLSGIREKVTQRKDLCLISSPHPDILAAIHELESRCKEPWAYHRFCLSHLHSQFYDLFEDVNLGCLLREAGSTSQKEEFDSYMKDIEKKNPEARKWLEQFSTNQWALAHDSGLMRYGIMEIDTEALFAVCESFQVGDDQAMTLTGSLLLLFDKLRSSFDDAFSCSRGSLSSGNVYTESVMDNFEGFMKASSTYVVKPLERDAFQVSRSTKKKERTICIVQLNDSTCTCGEFQRNKFPCLHALAVCDKLKINPLQYVDGCYTVERHYKTNAATFSRVPELSAWPEASGVPTLFPPHATMKKY